MNIANKTELSSAISKKYQAIEFCLNEIGRRLWCASEARTYGHGGIVLVSKATGVSNKTIHRGLKELRDQESIDKTRIRKSGGGRKLLKTKDPQLIKDLDALVEPTAKGDPESPLRWTSKSVRNLTIELIKQGHKVSFRSVLSLLGELGYSLQANKKTKEGSSHEDRDSQFQLINQTMTDAISCKEPCISVDTKKKEIVGEFKNNGKEYAPKGQPIEVNTHDFPDKKLGKVAPYGIYDIGRNTGWVSVGISSDTAEFAVHSIRTWWYSLGRKNYPNAKEINVTADCGGSNGYRVRLWKYELQKLSNELGFNIIIRHFPPGTSKWNKIEHRLFSYISKNWRGKPLVSVETIISLISNTTTNTGLKVMAVLDSNLYEKGRQISDEMMNDLSVVGHKFHPEWNYTITPRIM